MKTLILYTTRHGCTEKCAGLLKEKLQGTVDCIPLTRRPPVDLSAYDTVIVAGSIHAGNIQARVKKFVQDHKAALLQRRLGLFVCCMEQGEKAEQQLRKAYPEDLLKHAAATGIFGGEFDFDRMNFIERFLIKKIAKVTESVSRISTDAIDGFAAKIQSEHAD